MGGPAPVVFPECRADCAQLTGDEIALLKDALTDIEFGKKVAGTWALVEVSGEGQVIAANLFNLTAFGTAAGTQSNDFYPHTVYGMGHRYDSPTFGTWKRTGERQITITALSMHYDEWGITVAAIKEISVMDFSEDFETATVTGNAELFLPATDEQEAWNTLACDGEPEAVPWEGSTFSARRLCAYPPAEDS
jgi:hypothetical protein